MQLDHPEDNALFPDDPRVFDRTPPHDLLAEQSVLGGMLLARSVIDDVCEIVDAGDFYNPRHGVIFDAITTLHEDGEPVDAVAVVAHLASAGILDKVGGGPYVHELLAAVPTAANAPYYAGIVAARAQLRQVIETGTKLVQYGYNSGDRDVDEVVNLAQSALSQTVRGRRSNQILDFTEVLDETVTQILEADETTRGLSTGIGALDDVIGGLKPGQLVIVAGRPGMGKTILGVDMLRAAGLRRGESVLMHSLEMSKHDIQKRMLAAEAEVNLKRIMNGSLHEHERPRITAAAAKIRGCFVHIDDTASVNLAHVRATARQIEAQKGLALIVIDYLQLMDTGGDGRNRAVELGRVSSGLKVLARELNVPIVACAQLNRGSEARSDRRPQLSDLRESGSLEQDADIAVLLDRPDYHDPEHERSGEVDLIVAKNRNGPIETVTAAAQLHYARIVDIQV
jgi:replicative DNA helicase